MLFINTNAGLINLNNVKRIIWWKFDGKNYFAAAKTDTGECTKLKNQEEEGYSEETDSILHCIANANCVRLNDSMSGLF